MACAQQPEPALNAYPTRESSSSGETMVGHDNGCAPTKDGAHHKVLNSKRNLSSQDIFPLIMTSHYSMDLGCSCKNRKNNFR